MIRDRRDLMFGFRVLAAAGAALAFALRHAARLALASFLMFSVCATAGAQGLASPQEQNRFAASTDRKPMVFFRAKGASDSCGPGCSEWIAAVGEFTRGSAQQFRDFLSVASADGLPIFFHSPGGSLGEAMLIGLTLRDRRMTAGIGRTITDQCAVFSPSSDCRSLMTSGMPIKTRLVLDGAQCHSACIYAFSGASVRRVAAQARLGVHASRVNPKLAAEGKTAGKPDIAALRPSFQRYFITMGLDPEIEKLAAEVSNKRIYILSREEIARFGIETLGRYETRWIAYQETRESFVVVKALTQQTEPPPGGERLTTVVRISCGFHGLGVTIVYRRELPVKIARGTTSLSATIGSKSLAFWKPTREREGVEAGVAAAAQDLIDDAVAAPEIAVTETVVEAGMSPRSSSIKLSTAGLKDGMAQLQTRCSRAKV
jgi:hypothetical protein